MSLSLCRAVRRAVVPAVLVAAGVLAPRASGVLICWTESDGSRHWGGGNISCDRFFQIFGQYITPANNVRCYNLSGTALELGGCEPCIFGIGPGVDGNGLLGEDIFPIQPGQNHDFPIMCWNRRISDIRIVHPPGTPPGTWRIFRSFLPDMPDFGPNASVFVHVTQSGQPRSYVNFPMFDALPTNPVVGSDFVVHYSAVDNNSQQIFFQQEVAFQRSQMAYRELPPACLTDFTGNGVTNTQDLTIMLGNFGNGVAPFTDGDCDGDNIVTTADLVIFLGGFGQTCPTP